MTRFIRFTLATAAMALAAAGAHALEPRSGVKLRALDKITGNSTDITAKVGETLKFGRLSVTVKALLPGGSRSGLVDSHGVVAGCTESRRTRTRR
jgi:hypothetical protein